MELLGNVLYGTILEKSGNDMKICYFGELFMDRLKARDYMIKFVPTCHIDDERIREDIKELGIKKRHIGHLDGLSPIYIATDEIQKVDWDDNNNCLTMLMKTGNKMHSIFCDDDDTVDTKRALMTLAVIKLAEERL